MVNSTIDITAMPYRICHSGRAIVLNSATLSGITTCLKVN